MQVTIKNVDVEWNGTGSRKWGKAIVSYEMNGKLKTQNVMSFTNPAVFKQVQELVGQTVEVDIGKNDKGYDEWRMISSAGSAGQLPPSSTGSESKGTATATRVTGSNYETRDERAARQVLIVKQSSLSAAVATLAPGAKAALDPKAVIETAQEYADWVFNNDVEGFDDVPL